MSYEWRSYRKHDMHRNGNWHPGRDDSERTVLNEVELQQIEEMSVFQCTDEEIAHALGICLMTFNQILRRQEEVLKRIVIGRSKGKRALRSMQMKIALSGNVNMLMYLGKVVLNQMPDAKVNLNLGETPQNLTSLSPAAKAHLAELAQSITRAALAANTPMVEARVVSDEQTGNGHGPGHAPDPEPVEQLDSDEEDDASCSSSSSNADLTND